MSKHVHLDSNRMLPDGERERKIEGRGGGREGKREEHGGNTHNHDLFKSTQDPLLLLFLSKFPSSICLHSIFLSHVNTLILTLPL